MLGKEDDDYRGSLRASIELKGTDELLRIQHEHDLAVWTPEALQMVDTILRERGEYLMTSSDVEQTQEEDIYCLRCHAKIPPDGKFCPKCGDYQWDTCMVCDKSLPEDAKYCPYCGSLVKHQTNASKLNTIQSISNVQWWGFAIIILLLLWIVWQLFSVGVRISGAF